jgi:hypothetical protein
MRQVTAAVDFNGLMGSIMRRVAVAALGLTSLLAGQVQEVLVVAEVVVGKLLKADMSPHQLRLQQLPESAAVVVAVEARFFHQALLVKKA